MIPTAVRLGPLPGWLILWVALLLAVGLFARRGWFLLQLLRLGGWENRFDRLPERVKRVLIYVGAQLRLLDEPLVGIPHVLIFYGFVVFVISTSGMILQGLLPNVHLPSVEENRYLAPVVDIFAVLVLGGLAVSSFRRFVLRPAGLQQTRDATVVNILIASLMVTYVLVEAFRLIALPTEGGIWLPAGRWVAGLVGNSEFLRAGAVSFHHLFWWMHVLIVLGFLVYLPYSKHMHLLAAPFSIFFSQLDPPGRLAAPAHADKLGAENLHEFSWRQLLSGFACAECGRCERVCPSHLSGEPCSPRELVHNLKEQLLRYGPALLNKARPADEREPSMLGGLTAPAALWTCTTCMACAERCPVLNEHLSIVVNMRRCLVERGEVDPHMEEALRNLARYGNSFGQSERKRAVWTQALDFKPKDARKEPVEWLWYLGEYACYHSALQEITRSLARVLQAAQVNFGILYEAERNSGNDIRRVGEEGLFELLREKNTATLRQAQFKNLFSTDPHVYNTLKNEYPELDQGEHAVYHYTELLWDLLRNGQLKLKRKLPYRVTYHDPCYLGRYNGVYEAPRAVLRMLGVELTEMPRSGRNSFCCGGGGGRVWMEETRGVESRPSESRVREAASADGVQFLVVACPKDHVMFSDALKTTGLEGRLAIKDLAELVEEATTVAVEVECTV